MKKLTVLTSLIFLSSCETEAPIEETFNKNPELTMIKTSVEEIEYGGLPVLVQKSEDVYIHQGDIMIPKEIKSAFIYPSEAAIPKNKATSRTKGLWEEGIVYYQINPDLPKQHRVRNAIRMWEAISEITFVESQNPNGYIYFTTGGGCFSYIGRTGGKQPIILSNACSTGNTAHEIGHALGLWHEQSRADRNNHIKINWDNIQSGFEHNFETYSEQGWDGQELTNTLDFNSIMMYHPYSFSSNGKPTITKMDGTLYKSNRNKLSQQDIEGINKLYPKDSRPIYENGNYYYIDDITLYRDWNRWWYYTRNSGWKEVKKSSYGYWYYV